MALPAGANGSSERRLNGEDERTLEERRSRNEDLETVSYEISPVVPITLKTYTGQGCKYSSSSEMVMVFDPRKDGEPCPGPKGRSNGRLVVLPAIGQSGQGLDAITAIWPLPPD